MACEQGYIYAMFNRCMPALLKIGMTTRTLEQRLKEANRHSTFKPPLPYEYVLTRYVNNPSTKEKQIHNLITKYHKRIDPKKEFFEISVEDLSPFFQMFDEVKPRTKTCTKETNTIELNDTESVGSSSDNNDLESDSDEKAALALLGDLDFSGLEVNGVDDDDDDDDDNDDDEDTDVVEWEFNGKTYYVIEDSNLIFDESAAEEEDPKPIGKRVKENGVWVLKLNET